jgi:Zn-dependent protease with chaperone function
MILTLGAFLETVAVLAAAAACASLVVPPLALTLRRLQIAPAARADLAVAVAALPAVSVMVAAVAVALPGTLDVLGLSHDHCHEHGGHGHLCFAHPVIAAPAVVAVGAAALAVTLVRAGWWLSTRLAAARALAQLLPLGRPVDRGSDLLVFPGDTVLCHAAGSFSSRVLLSSRLVAGLPADLLGAAVEHERAHVRRRDVLARDVLSVLGLFTWPGVGASAVATWEESAEEAADAEAAQRFGGPVLARALVSVARLSMRSVPGSMPLVGARLARRVESLLARPPAPRPARALGLLPWVGGGLLVLAAYYADPLHHAAETALHAVVAS